MGCWSESCGISGLEIGYNHEALVMLVEPVAEKGYSEHGTFSRYQPVTTLVWGKYSDYGDLEDISTCDPLYFTDWLEKARRKIDPSQDNHMDYMSKFFWIRKDVWDFLDNIPHEFSYGDRPKNIGESIRRTREKWTEKFEELMAGSVSNDDSTDALIARALARMADDNFCGLTYRSGKIYSKLREEFNDAVDEKDREKAMNAIEAALRISKLDMAGYELRKVVAPSTMNGPQHGGYEAISMLATFNLKKCQEYFSDIEE